MGAAQTILIVEDDSNLAGSLAKGLMESGYACQVAGSIRAAREALEELTPALVLLDMGLPDGDACGILIKGDRERTREGRALKAVQY